MVKKTPLLVTLYTIAFLLFTLPSTIKANPSLITLSNHSNSLIYLPKDFQKNKKTPYILILHDRYKSNLSSIKTWQKIADEENYILLCLEGQSFKQAYTRAPIDDRKQCVGFHKWLVHNYQIDIKDSLLVGHGRGGNFALETALLYPKTFPNAIIHHGYLNKNMKPKLKKQLNTDKLNDSYLYLITTKHHPTYHNLVQTRQMLGNQKTNSQIQVDPAITLLAHIKKINQWKERKESKHALY